LLCDGSGVSTTTYADLFAVIGYTYGGSGSLFALPDLRGRTPVGLDNMGGTDAGRLSVSNILGGTGGTQTHQLSTAEMPVHTHTQDPHYHTAGSYDGSFGINNSAAAAGGSFQSLVLGGGPNARIGTNNQTATNQNAGGSGGVTAAHNNMQPYILTNYIIKF
jgi:microcystin-dependent protein